MCLTHSWPQHQVSKCIPIPDAEILMYSDFGRNGYHPIQSIHVSQTRVLGIQKQVMYLTQVTIIHNGITGVTDSNMGSRDYIELI